MSGAQHVSDMCRTTQSHAQVWLQHFWVIDITLQTTAFHHTLVPPVQGFLVG